MQKNGMDRKSLQMLFLAGYILTFWLVPPRLTTAAVTLVYFNAVSGNRLVILRWETATETNNVGFYIQRSSQINSGFVRINDDIIPAQGSDLSGSTYEYIDLNLSNGTQYWYRLESVDASNNSQYSDPISVTVGGTAMPTPSPTTPISVTNTPFEPPTSTPTGIGATYTPTLAVLPTATQVSPDYPPPGFQATLPLILQETQNPGAGFASITSIPGGPTSTLIPFPTVTILFPQQDEAITLFDSSNKSGEGNQSPILQRAIRLWPILVLILGWVGLGVWFYWSQKHL
jgi:hypothetical protein